VLDDRLAVELVNSPPPAKAISAWRSPASPIDLLAASDALDEQAAILLTAAMEEGQAAVLFAGTMTNPEGMGLRARARRYQRAAKRIREWLR